MKPGCFRFKNFTEKAMHTYVFFFLKSKGESPDHAGRETFPVDPKPQVYLGSSKNLLQWCTEERTFLQRDKLATPLLV
jgi:hypothetical protein